MLCPSPPLPCTSMNLTGTSSPALIAHVPFSKNLTLTTCKRDRREDLTAHSGEALFQRSADETGNIWFGVAGQTTCGLSIPYEKEQVAN